MCGWIRLVLQLMIIFMNNDHHFSKSIVAFFFNQQHKAHKHFFHYDKSPISTELILPTDL